MTTNDERKGNKPLAIGLVSVLTAFVAGYALAAAGARKWFIKIANTETAEEMILLTNERIQTYTEGAILTGAIAGVLVLTLFAFLLARPLLSLTVQLLVKCFAGEVQDALDKHKQHTQK